MLFQSARVDMNGRNFKRENKDLIDCGWKVEVADHSHIEDCRQIYNSARHAAGIFETASASAYADFETIIKDELLLVAIRSDGLIGGFSGIYLADAFLHHLYVAPPFQRQGLGRLLLQASRRQLTTPLRLKCIVANTAARLFYRSVGWRGGDFGGPSPDGDWLWIEAPPP